MRNFEQFNLFQLICSFKRAQTFFCLKNWVFLRKYILQFFLAIRRGWVFLIFKQTKLLILLNGREKKSFLRKLVLKIKLFSFLLNKRLRDF